LDIPMNSCTTTAISIAIRVVTITAAQLNYLISSPT